jgi:predicted phosphatase
MKRQRLPDTDSIQELARFWDTHDLTDFEPALEEVVEPVFVRSKGASLAVDLPRRDVQRVKQIAKSRGVSDHQCQTSYTSRTKIL